MPEKVAEAEIVTTYRYLDEYFNCYGKEATDQMMVNVVSVGGGLNGLFLGCVILSNDTGVKKSSLLYLKLTQ